MLKKSLLTLALCSLFGFLSAQSLQFGYFDDEVVFHGYANNQVVICDNTPNSETFQIDFEKVGIKNLTGAALDVMVKKEEISLVPGTENSFCWGECYASFTFLSTHPITINANATSEPTALSFHHQIDPTWEGNLLPGTSVVRYYAFPEGHPEDAAMLEVWFAYHAENVPEIPISFGKASPNPATSIVRFELQGGHAPVKAVVYNLLGQEVKSQTAYSVQDKIEFTVSDLQDGIYFCSFFINDEMVKTDKFIVKR